MPNNEIKEILKIIKDNRGRCVLVIDRSNVDEFICYEPSGICWNISETSEGVIKKELEERLIDEYEREIEGLITDAITEIQSCLRYKSDPKIEYYERGDIW